MRTILAKSVVTIALLSLFANLCLGDFMDAFDGPGLDARWTSDNSPSNPVGSDIAIVAGQAVGIGSKENLYNHLEAAIDAGGDFSVQVDARVDVGQNWGAALVVYWDTSHFIVLKAPRNSKFRSEVYNGSTFTTTNSSLTYVAGTMATLRMEFGPDTIEFYAKNQGDAELTYLSALDIVRAEWTKGPGAILVIGKGRQDNSLYTNPDYDNDYAFAGAIDQIVLDNASFGELITGPQCGDPGTLYFAADFNQDCYVNVGDFGELAGQWLWTGAPGGIEEDLDGDGDVALDDFVNFAARWLWCSHPGDPNCCKYEQHSYSDYVLVWEIDPYENFLKTITPAPATPQLQDIHVEMAKGEFRDAMFMVGPYSGSDLNLEIRVESCDGIPEEMVLVQETLYVLNKPAVGPDQFTGDAVYPLTSPLVLPAGECRQVRLRFDARSIDLLPGSYSFTVILNDVDNEREQAISGTLEVWDFELPSTDMLPNHCWVMIKGTDWGGQALTNGIQEMKKYGLNYIYVSHTELPKAVDVDENGNILFLDTVAFAYRVSSPLTAWEGGAGDEELNYIFYLYDLTLGQTGGSIIEYPSALWNTLFGNWIAMTRNFLQTQYGIGGDRWMLVLGDEESDALLMDYTIPLAETIKGIDPTIRLTCNSSATLSEPWASRYFAAFDVFQPNLQYYEQRPELRTFHQSHSKDLWSYKCAGYCGGVGFDVYRYYRSYGWRTVKYGMTGMGLWTYCVSTGGETPYDWPGYNPSGVSVNFGHRLAWKHWANDDIVHCRRYEMYRETIDDYRYILKLRELADQVGGQAPANAETLIDQAITDIINNNSDHTRCDYWRKEIASRILSLESSH